MANGRPAWAAHDAPHDLAVLAHELRRRVAALRVAGEAIATLRSRRGTGTDRGPAGLPTASGVRAGHGIGLVLVRRFLDATGGRSWLAERQGGGTMVGLSLPLRHGQDGGGRLEDAVST